MPDNLNLFGVTYSNVAGIKATDTNGSVQTYIRPQGTMSITSNGTYDVNQYASAAVNIVTPEPYLEEDTILPANYFQAVYPRRGFHTADQELDYPIELGNNKYEYRCYTDGYQFEVGDNPIQTTLINGSISGINGTFSVNSKDRFDHTQLDGYSLNYTDSTGCVDKVVIGYDVEESCHYFSLIVTYSQAYSSSNAPTITFDNLDIVQCWDGYVTNAWYIDDEWDYNNPLSFISNMDCWLTGYVKAGNTITKIETTFTHNSALQVVPFEYNGSTYNVTIDVINQTMSCSLSGNVEYAFTIYEIYTDEYPVGFSVVNIPGDDYLEPENIKAGVTIYGVEGVYDKVLIEGELWGDVVDYDLKPMDNYLDTNKTISATLNDDNEFEYRIFLSDYWLYDVSEIKGTLSLSGITGAVVIDSKDLYGFTYHTGYSINYTDTTGFVDRIYSESGGSGETIIVHTTLASSYTTSNVPTLTCQNIEVNQLLDECAGNAWGEAAYGVNISYETDVFTTDNFYYLIGQIENNSVCTRVYTEFYLSSTRQTIPFQYGNNTYTVTIDLQNQTFSYSFPATPNAGFDILFYKITPLVEYPAGFSHVYLHGDSNLIPENIKSGVSIYGYEGTYDGTMTPLVYDYNIGYVQAGTWTYENPTNTYSDIYEVESGHKYIICLGANVGTRFRGMFTTTDIRQVSSGSVVGSQVVNYNDPPAFSVALYTPESDGYIIVAKDNVGKSGVNTYVIDQGSFA